MGFFSKKNEIDKTSEEMIKIVQENEEKVNPLHMSEHEKYIENKTEELIRLYNTEHQHELLLLRRKKMSQDKFMELVEDTLAGIEPDNQNCVEVLEKFKSFIFSYDILDALIEDDTISDIKVLAFDNVRVKREGQRESANIQFPNSAHYDQFIDHVAVKNEINLSDNNAVQTFTDKKTSDKAIMRFNITTGFINSSEHPYLHIRKIPKHKRNIETLIKAGMMDRNTADYLKYQSAKATGMLFTGKGASGKTTAMNTFLDHIPFNRSGLVIQENEELFSKVHPDLMFQHVVTNRGESKVKYTLQDLARNGLLTDLDYFIIGEIKGGEARDFLNAAYTGHQCWASVHGASSTEAIDKLADYVKLASDYSKIEAMSMLKHLQVVIFMQWFKVVEISEITGWDDDKKELIYKPILRDGILLPGAVERVEQLRAEGKIPADVEPNPEEVEENEETNEADMQETGAFDESEAG